MTTRRFALVHLPLAAGLLMICFSAPLLAADACSQWGVGSVFSLKQSNAKYAVRMKLQQTGSQIKGAANYDYWYDTGALGVGATEMRHTSGPIVGTVSGNQFEATIYWSNASVGVYTGQISPQGLLVGRSYDKTDPAAAADFHSDEPLVCLTRMQSAPGLGTVPAKPPVALGRVPHDAPQPTPTAICDAAKSARARNSPAAAGLERQCNALARTTAKPSLSADEAVRSAVDKIGGTPLARKVAGRAEAPLSLAPGSPVDTLKNKTDPVLLNPQPLPPIKLQPQAPSALR
jgi:hypothetical protein